MRNEYCEFLKALSEKEYDFDDISILLESIENFENKLNDEDDEVDDIINDLSVLRNKLENWQLEQDVSDFNYKLKECLLSKISYFE